MRGRKAYKDTSDTFFRCITGRGKNNGENRNTEGHGGKEKNEICLFNLSLHFGRWWENLNFKVLHNNLEYNLDGKFLAGLHRPFNAKNQKKEMNSPLEELIPFSVVTFSNTDPFTRNDETNTISAFEKFPWSGKSTHTYTHILWQWIMQAEKNSGSFSHWVLGPDPRYSTY